MVINEMIELKRMDIRQAISELEQEKPKNLKEFEFREDEINRLLDLLPR